jgi:outer membrane protein assembly factor BamB
VYVSEGSADTVDEYDASTGALIRTINTIAGGFPVGLAVFGTNLLVAFPNKIGVYNATTGVLLNSDFIDFTSGGNSPPTLLIAASTLYVPNYDFGTGTTVGMYNAATGVGNANFITGLTGPPFGLAINSSQSCYLHDTISYSSGVLTMNFTLANPGSFVWNTSLSFQGTEEQLFSHQLPPTSVPITKTATVSLSSIGTVGVLSTITTMKGIVCSNWQTVNTGP